jgi:hypothetical protein
MGIGDTEAVALSYQTRPSPSARLWAIRSSIAPQSAGVDTRVCWIGKAFRRR